MLVQNGRLWAGLCKEFPEAAELVIRQAPLTMDWKIPSALPPNAVIIGSYLFSRAESFNYLDTANAFATFLNTVRALGLISWTKPNKSSVLIGVKNQLKGWKDYSPQTLFDCPVEGRMRECVDAAQKYYATVGYQPDTGWLQKFNWGSAPLKAFVLVMSRS